MAKKEFNSEGCIALANAIVVSASRDYMKAVNALKRNPRNRAAGATMKECERFFDSKWYAALTNVDGAWLKKKLREEALMR